jgi:hypothetical protein
MRPANLLLAVVSVLLVGCPDPIIPDIPSIDPQMSNANASERATFLGRAYLPEVLPSSKELRGYAGYILDVYGKPGVAGACVPDTAQIPRTGGISYIKAGRQPKAESVNDILFQNVINSGVSAEAGFLTFLTAGMSDSNRAEVIIEDVIRQDAFDVLDNAKLATEAGKALPAGVCAREVIVVAVLTSFKTRTFRETDARASFAGTAVSVDGRVFTKMSDFSNTYRLFIESRPLSSYAAGNVAAIQAAPKPPRPVMGFPFLPKNWAQRSHR